jgi:hypothetical protein
MIKLWEERNRENVARIERLEAENVRLKDTFKKLDTWQGKQSCHASLYLITDDDFGELQFLIHDAPKGSAE